MSTVSVALDSRDHLGEGPYWDEHLAELLRVDISRGRVHGWSPSSGSTWCREHDGEVSAIVPRSGEEGFVLAAGHRLLLDDGDGLQVLSSVEVDRPTNRFNDCKCDPQGRLWAGTMSTERTPGSASMYRLTPGSELERVIPSTTISNGMAWSPDGEHMYFTDSTTQRIDVFDFDGSDGAIANRRTFAEIDALDGLPDGMTVDAEGGVWVCLFGGSAVRRYNPDGTLEAAIPLPVTNPTSPVFGGPGLRTLYITSARHRLSSEQLKAEPLAGAVLAVKTRMAGLSGNRFAG